MWVREKTRKNKQTSILAISRISCRRPHGAWGALAPALPPPAHMSRVAVGAPQAGGEIHEERFMKRKEKKETKRKRRGSRVAVGAPQAGGEIRERKRRKKEEERKERKKKEKRKRKEREKKEERKEEGLEWLWELTTGRR